ncbi:hypothetical protein EHI8A_025680 [Entamoeba histolytica HM-1:IMSS-B]|uniref:Uncharacterized protein n=6 Tax=Entamoeba histolytica TaxID=5759 RepID=C4M7Q7_ENTH1|nr:hypothetical protein EHI_120910 [Entamoeba histolytica HM-1:IMSS]EMD43508.1 Hypothetical protein EHI5A_054660 [Entamoeba histolytica KU27]EMH75929.1 hypothetical protein EHI8A_025680 [Entamoeba histolytica HM-1:IMSS-B]EMS16669.1 hypothetical protein KM1_062590 [Entamoeba histolytica HM-3:IMSS]ENY65350.1 hypothetical protein EHI7A_028420 [Entamoeba histolytica HM-1:IMSS-A]GAT97583.1 hypothetical protein CL6EHI_120910 [Entamoeba histolytica]|eukprot:XP_654346.1 hypothetical protein EHI_120910 [Entamoeba histolytica HM-1:IMSS]
MKMIIILISFYISYGYELNMYLLPHVLPEWKTDQTKIWKNWKYILDFHEIFMKEITMVYHIPDFYLNQKVNIDTISTTFYDLMSPYNMTFLTPTSNIEDIKTLLLPYLNHDITAPKRGIGLLFQKTSSGKCLGTATKEDIQKLKSIDDEFKTYENYLGMDIMDASVLQQFDISNDFSSEFPDIRAIHFNYFNTFETSSTDDAIELAKKFHSSISIDISDIETQFFVSCPAFKKILETIIQNGVNYKFMVNRSIWVQNIGAFLSFYNTAQKCLDNLI